MIIQPYHASRLKINGPRFTCDDTNCNNSHFTLFLQSNYSLIMDFIGFKGHVYINDNRYTNHFSDDEFPLLLHNFVCKAMLVSLYIFHSSHFINQIKWHIIPWYNLVVIKSVYIWYGVFVLKTRRYIWLNQHFLNLLLISTQRAYDMVCLCRWMQINNAIKTYYINSQFHYIALYCYISHYVFS